MTRIAVIGGSGHVGTYLLPDLVGRGHEVINVSRGQARPYSPHAAWHSVRQVTVDRTAEEAAGTFAGKIADLKADVVIDMIAFELPSTQALVEALRGKVGHFIHCSTIWVYGSNPAMPATEDEPMVTFGDYGTKKAEIETWLQAQAHRTGFPASIFRPGHIVGPGWIPVNPQGHGDPEVFSIMARGDELALPGFGAEMLHHVHASDVAQVITGIMTHRSAALGEAFNAVSAQALSLRGYAEGMYRWFGHAPKLRFEPFDEWSQGLDPETADWARQHIVRSSCQSIEKGRRLIDYAPRYSSIAAIQESVAALIANGIVTAPPDWAAA